MEDSGLLFLGVAIPKVSSLILSLTQTLNLTLTLAVEDLGSGKSWE